MQLEQVDPLHPKTAPGLLDLLTQDRGPGVEPPLAAGSGARDPTFVVITSSSG
nr:hypothetical protein [Amycolatopsis sp. RTGN1]